MSPVSSESAFLCFDLRWRNVRARGQLRRAELHQKVCCERNEASLNTVLNAFIKLKGLCPLQGKRLELSLVVSYLCDSQPSSKKYRVKKHFQLSDT